MGETSPPFDEVVASDAALAECARQGNGAAFSALVARHCQAVYLIARNMFVSSGDVAEVTRQTFLSAYRDLREWRGTVAFATWLNRIAIKAALAHRLRHRRSPPCSLESFLPRFDRKGCLVPTIDHSPVPGNGSPERIGVTAVLREGLEFMDDDIRAAFVLRDLLELPVDEVAAVLETSPQDVGRRIHKARLMLHGLLARL
jgi:RNA polymerase sigma-70 factor (ECF subfamily)